VPGVPVNRSRGTAFTLHFKLKPHDAVTAVVLTRLKRSLFELQRVLADTDRTMRVSCVTIGLARWLDGLDGLDDGADHFVSDSLIFLYPIFLYVLGLVMASPIACTVGSIRAKLAQRRVHFAASHIRTVRGQNHGGEPQSWCVIHFALQTQTPRRGYLHRSIANNFSTTYTTGRSQ